MTKVSIIFLIFYSWKIIKIKFFFVKNRQSEKMSTALITVQYSILVPIYSIIFKCAYHRSKSGTLLACYSRRIRRCLVRLLGRVSYCRPKTVPSVPLPPPTVELYRPIKK